MTNAAISKMSIGEKISTLEMLWNDLCQHTNLESPDWHQDILKNRYTKKTKAIFS